MIKVSVIKWGNSKGIKLPKSVTGSLNIQINDYLELEVKNDTIILSKPENDLTIEEMFKDYDAGTFQVDIHEFELLGNEKW